MIRLSLAARLKETRSMTLIPPSASRVTETGTRTRFVLVAALAGLALSGCAKRSVDIQAQIPDVYQERHPIVVGDVSRQLDIFLASNGGIGLRQSDDLKEFVTNYRKNGKGALFATLPPGAPGGAVHQTLNEIRSIAAQGGVSGGYLRVESNGPTFQSAAAIRLHYAQLDAKVTSKCGFWPYDPSGSTTLQSWENRPHYNLGCSYQSMMAAQVANPLDHLRSRPEGVGDIAKRLDGIEKVREGNDPTTKWPADQTKISQALQ